MNRLPHKGAQNGLNAIRGFGFFLAIFMGGLTILYGFSGVISSQPFVADIMAPNTPWTYFDFVGFWFWFIILPISFWVYVIRPAGETHRVRFHT